MDAIVTLDYQILQGIGTLHTEGWTTFFRIITAFGDAGAIWILLGMILLLHRGTRRHGAAILASLLLATLLGECGLKLLVQRARPPVADPGLFTALIPLPSGFSFPSGHSFSSFACATALFCYHKRAGIAAYILASLIAFSRLYLYVHFPSDVCAGMVLGILVGVIVAISLRHILDAIHYARLRR